MLNVIDEALRAWVPNELLGEREDPRFQRVTLKIREANGSYRKDEKNPLQDFKQIRILDRNTGQLYLDDPVDVVAIKCFVLSMANIPRFIISLGSSALFLPWSFVELSTRFVQEIFASFTPDVDRPSLQTRLFTCVLEGVAKAMYACWEVLRAPYYAAGMQIACMRGALETVLFWNGYKALAARSQVAYIEKRWNNSVDVNQTGEIGRELCPKAMYLARCFQTRHNIGEKVAGRDRYEVVEVTKPLVDAETNPDCVCRQSFASCA